MIEAIIFDKDAGDRKICYKHVINVFIERFFAFILVIKYCNHSFVFCSFFIFLLVYGKFTQ